MTLRDHVSITESANVSHRARALGSAPLTGLAILPRNFLAAGNREDLEHEDSVVAVRKLWKQAGVDESKLERGGERFGRIQENAVTWIAPTVFIAFSLWSQNPALTAIGLNVIANYATDLLKGATGTKRVKAAVVLERKDGTCRKVEYDGPVEGLRELTGLVREVYDDNRK